VDGAGTGRGWRRVGRSGRAEFRVGRKRTARRSSPPRFPRRKQIALVAGLLVLANGTAVGIWWHAADDSCQAGAAGCKGAAERPLPPLEDTGTGAEPTGGTVGSAGVRPGEQSAASSTTPLVSSLPLPGVTAGTRRSATGAGSQARARSNAASTKAAGPLQSARPSPRPVPAVRYVTRYVSDLPFLAAENGFGPVERDRSNGERKDGDGRTQRIRGVRYAKGLGVHSDSDVQLLLGGRCARFVATIGIDDEAHVDSDGRGTDVAFRLVADGSVIYRSPELWRHSGAVAVNVDVSRVQLLSLQVDDLGYRYGDHANWAAARLTCRAG
jgi:NPCBM/NEW2 domain